jgi:PTS system nitrogen regulatory IIA component
MHFGSTLRFLRLDSGISIRELARRIGVSSAYLSRVENGYDPPPTPHRLATVADAIGVPRAALLELARQTGPAVADYLDRVPAAGALLLEIAGRDLQTAQIARLKALLDVEFPRARVRRGPTLTDLLSPERIAIGFEGENLGDLVAVAAARLPESRGIDPAEVAEILARKEASSPSLLGGGIAAPHAVIPGIPRTAVLVVAARPLACIPPDGEPVRVGVVVLSARSDAVHLEILSRVARLARYRVASELCAAPTPAAVRALVAGLEILW